jgi:hypothetical protein
MDRIDEYFQLNFILVPCCLFIVNNRAWNTLPWLVIHISQIFKVVNEGDTVVVHEYVIHLDISVGETNIVQAL